jgi:transcriptional regulator with XRE-family HTH domain
MTVRALAGDAGVTPGFISQIENGRVMPSIGTLVRIASILTARVGDLFDGEASELSTATSEPSLPTPNRACGMSSCRATALVD